MLEPKGTRISLDDVVIAHPELGFDVAPPCGVELSSHCTILITDIIGSSKIYRDEGDRVGLLIANRKFEIASALANEETFVNDIYIVKTMGDAILFFSPKIEKMLSFVKGFIIALAGQTKPIPIRSTLHFGKFLIYEPPILKGKDIFGETVNTTARVEGEGKRIAKDMKSAIPERFLTYPIFVSEEVMSALSGDNPLRPEAFLQQSMKIRECGEKDFLGFFIDFRLI